MPKGYAMYHKMQQKRQEKRMYKENKTICWVFVYMLDLNCEFVFWPMYVVLYQAYKLSRLLS